MKGILGNMKLANDNFAKHFDETSKKLTGWHQNDQPFCVVSMYETWTLKPPTLRFSHAMGAMGP